MIIDPIPELGSFIMAVAVFRPGDPELEAALTSFKERTRTARAGGVEAWKRIYAEALDLFARVLAANDQLKAQSAPAERSPSIMGGTPGNVATIAGNVLQQQQGVWQGRLQSQVRGDLLPKLERSIAQLPVSGVKDATVGMTVFRIPADALADFVRWVTGVEVQWAKHNGGLAVLRAREALAEVLGPDAQVPPIGELTLPHPEPCTERSLRLTGHSVPTPGPFDLVGSSYKFVMSGVTAVSGLGFLASRTLSPSLANTALPYVLGGTFALAVVAAGLTVPRRYRQGLARLTREATARVHAELRQALEARINQQSSDQLNHIRRYLGAEATRLAASERLRVSPRPEPSVPGLRRPPLMESDEVRLRGDWHLAVERRLRELS